MIEKVKRYAKKWHMLKKEDRIIVGVSGGADSVCLLFVLREIQKEIPYELFVVHVNHNLRGEAAKADEQFVQNLCAKLDLPFFVYSENVELFAKNRKQSTEEAGRNIRRECFQKTVEKVNANKIALAHHKNDSVETMLLNLARGTGLKGLGGIRPIQGLYIRPFLCVTRAEIENYLQKQLISYCDDITNSGDDYTRNRVRNHIIPYLEQEINSSAVQHMAETMEQLQQIQEFMEEALNEKFPKVAVIENDSYLIKNEEFERLHPALQSLAIKKALCLLSGFERDIEQIHLQSIKELFQKQVGKSVDLPYQLLAKRVYDGVRIQRKVDFKEEEFIKEIHLKPGEEAEFWTKGKKIYCKVAEKEQETYKYEQKAGKQCFDYDIIQNGVTIRTRRPGDYITIHPDGRTQKLKSFFINEKIPQEERDQILLVADGSHIIWIEGIRSNCVYQIRSNTKHVLEIHVDKGVHYGRKN